MSCPVVENDAEKLRVVMMQSSGERPTQPPDVDSLRELLARLERCEQMLPSTQQTSGPQDADPQVATPAPAPTKLPAWFSSTNVATSFAIGFALTLIAVTMAMRPGQVGVAQPAAEKQAGPVQFASSGAQPVARNASVSSPAPAKAAGSDEGGEDIQSAGKTGSATTSSPARSPNETTQTQVKQAHVDPDKVETKPEVSQRPKLSVAGRLETEVGGTVPFAIALADAPRAETDAAMLVRGIPDDVALSPAWPMGSGVWFVNPVDAGKLRLTLYAAPRKDSQLSVKLWSPEGNLIATANALLVAPPRSSETPVAATIVDPPKSESQQAATPPATVLASRPEPEKPAAPQITETPPPPVVEAPTARSAAPAQRTRRRAARHRLPRSEQRNASSSRQRGTTTTLAAQPGLVWPGDAPPGPAVRRASPRRSSPAAAARPAAPPAPPRRQASAGWPSSAFGQSRAP
jgi:hypothetical protein